MECYGEGFEAGRQQAVGSKRRPSTSGGGKLGGRAVWLWSIIYENPRSNQTERPREHRPAQSQRSPSPPLNMSLPFSPRSFARRPHARGSGIIARKPIRFSAIAVAVICTVLTLLACEATHAQDRSAEPELQAATSAAESTSKPENLFRERIAPILTARCQACHGTKTEGGYSVATPKQFLTAGDSEATPVVPNKLHESELWRRLISEDESERMPTDSDPLSPAQLAAVKTWIEAGAPIDKADLDRALVELTIATLVAAPKHYPRPLAVHALALNREGSEVLVGGYAEVTRWRVQTGELIGRYPVEGPHVASIAVSGDFDQMVTSSGSPGQRGVIELVALNAPQPNDLQPQHSKLPVTADVAPHIGLSPAGNRVAIGGHDGSLRVAQILRDHRFGDVQVQTPHADAVLAVAWAENGERLITASRDRTAKLFDATSLELLASYDRHERAVGGAGFFGKRTLSFDETGRLRMMAGDDSDNVVTDQSGLPRVLQQIAVTQDEVIIADRHRLRRFRIEKKTVDNGKSEDGKPKTKDVTRFREQPALDTSPGQWITSVTANASAIAAGTQQGSVIIWHHNNEERATELNVTP